MYRGLLRACLCALIALTASSPQGRVVHGQSPQPEEVTVDFGPFEGTDSLRLAIADAIGVGQANVTGTHFLITWQQKVDDWYFMSLTSLDGDGCIPTAESHGVDGDCTYPLLASKSESDKWDIGIYPSVEFTVLVPKTSDDLIAPEAKKHLVAPAQFNPSNETLVFKFPWVGTWMYTQGWHSPISNGDGLDIGTGGSDKRVLASASGTLLPFCTVSNGQSVNVKILHDDGTRLDYYHLRLSSLRPGVQAGQRVVQGEEVGDLMQGSFDELPCGYASQNASRGHLHWDFPQTPDGATFAADSCTITMHRNAGSGPGSNWICGSTVVSPSLSNPGRLTLTNSPPNNACCNCSLVNQGGDRLLWRAIMGTWDDLFMTPLLLPLSSKPARIEPNLLGMIAAEPRMIVINKPEKVVFTLPAVQDIDWRTVSYRVYWGDNPQGTGDILVTTPSYTTDEVIQP